MTDLNRASARVAVGRYEGNASSRALVEDYRNRSFSLLFVGRPVLLPRYSLGGLNYANRHERCGMVVEVESEKFKPRMTRMIRITTN